MQQVKFGAPWSRQLRILTVVFTLFLLGLPAILINRAPENPPAIYLVSIWLPLAILALSALFAIRGFIIEPDRLLVLRPLWKTSLSLTGLEQAEHDPQAMDGSIRTFGNGGLFGFIGLFRNKKLGRYRAFATDQKNAVVLRFPTHTLVITPDRPARAAELLNGQT
ncbi:PH domain-containing protein [Microbulbifer guangxiensis]|uniref:PH domain-containing protein n=1 Tax=Microbulbifer guangxiensis TaxID=2904249 RepID=UPI001F417785|nr:PH domain-containing protein [Microbulbifer guangxiensis]